MLHKIVFPPEAVFTTQPRPGTNGQPARLTACKQLYDLVSSVPSKGHQGFDMPEMRRRWPILDKLEGNPAFACLEEEEYQIVKWVALEAEIWNVTSKSAMLLATAIEEAEEIDPATLVPVEEPEGS